MKLSIDNLLSSDVLNTSGSGVNNLSHTDSPHLLGQHQQARQQSPTHHGGAARKSSNNILSNMGNSNEYDSPYNQNGTTVNLTNA